MTTIDLIFRAPVSGGVMAAVLAALAVLLAGWGVRQLVARRWGYAAVCLASAAGPQAGVPLAAAAALIRWGRLSARAAAAAWMAGGAVAAGLTAWACAAVLQGPLSPGAWFVLLGLEILLAIGVFYSAVYSYLGPRRSAILTTLRAAAVLALLAALFRPAFGRTYQPQASRPFVPVLIDASASMATPDGGHAGQPPRALSRFEAAGDAAKRVAAALGPDARPVFYRFGQNAQRAESLEAVQAAAPGGPQGVYTDLRAALSAVRTDLAGEPVGAALLLTDCVDNPVDADEKRHRTPGGGGQARRTAVRGHGGLGGGGGAVRRRPSASRPSRWTRPWSSRTTSRASRPPSRSAACRVSP